MLYALLKVALQGSIATHIYALVRDVYKCCKLANKCAYVSATQICVAVKICHMLSGFIIIILYMLQNINSFAPNSLAN